MNRDDRDDPFDDFFEELERMLEDMMGPGGPSGGDPSGFASETHVDVHETTEEVRVVADLPGVSKDDLSLTCDGEHLVIAASTAHRDSEEHVQLPARVDEHSADATFNNGVLEVALEKADGSADIHLG